MSTTSNLVEFFQALFGDPAEAAAFQADPQKYIEEHDLEETSYEEINEAVYSGSRTTSTGVTPEGIPGFQADLCDYCSYDPEAAEAAFNEWTDAGNEQSEPMPIQRAKSGPSALPAKPPMSGPEKGWPDSPRLSTIGIDQARCLHSETLSPVQVAA